VNKTFHFFLCFLDRGHQCIVIVIGRREVDGHEGHEIRHTGRRETYAIGAASKMRAPTEIRYIRTPCPTSPSLFDYTDEERPKSYIQA